MIIYHQGNQRTFEYGIDDEAPITVYGVPIGIMEGNDKPVFFVLHPDKKNIYEIDSLMIPFESLFKWYIMSNMVVKEVYEAVECDDNVGDVQ
jgi:hypothetical protein